MYIYDIKLPLGTKSFQDTSVGRKVFYTSVRERKNNLKINTGRSIYSQLQSLGADIFSVFTYTERLLLKLNC